MIIKNDNNALSWADYCDVVSKYLNIIINSMAYIEKKGNIFNSKAMAIVNTVNCVGAMGKGIALDFKLRYPEMFKEYQQSLLLYG